MTSYSTYRFLSDLLDALAADGFPMGTGKHLQVQELLSKLPEDLPLASYKTILAPLFATNRQDQERFYELFDNALRREEALQKKLEETTPTPVPEEVKQVRRWRDVVLGLLIALAGVAGFIFDTAVWSTWLLVGGVVAFAVYFAMASLSKWDRRILYWSLLLLAGVGGFFSKVRTIEPIQPKTVYQNFPVTPGEAHHLPITFREDSLIDITFANNSNRDTNEVLGILQLDAPDSTCCFTYIARDSFPRSLNDTIAVLQSYSNVTDTTYFIAQYQKPIETAPEPEEETNIAELDTLPIPYPRDISELYVDTKLEQRAAFYNQWAWLIKLALSLLFGAILWAIVQWRERRRRRLVAELDRKDEPPYVWTLKLEHPEDIAYGEAIPLLLNQLRRRRFSEAFRLDVPRTITATVRSAGRVAFQFRQMTSPPDYLLLIDHYNANDHRAALFNRLYEVFRANEVNIERFYYQGDPRLCFNEAYPNGIRLQELQHRFSDARLLLLGNGYDLLSPRSGKPAKWLSIFTHWRERAFFTPQPLGNWGKREAALGDWFYLMPASIESFTATLEEFGSTDPRQPGELIAKLEDVPWRSIELEGDLLRTLRQHYAEPLVQWIAACAVFPTLSWDLTLHLGRELSTEAEPLLTLDNLFSLSRLPWFIEGRIPDAAREELIAYLQQVGLETRVRQRLHHLFEQALKPDQNSVAYEDYRLNALTNELLFTTSRSKRRQLQAELDRYLAAGAEPDVVSFKYLKERQRSVVDFVVPEQWKVYFSKTGNIFVRWKERVWILLLWVLLITGIWVYKPDFEECKGLQVEYKGEFICLESDNDNLLYFENLKKDFILTKDSIELVTALIQISTDSLWKMNPKETTYGQAFFYDDDLQGALSASNERYNKDELVAAHKTYPFGSLLKVTRLDNKKSVVVRVFDRGPYTKARAVILILSRKAAEKLDFIDEKVTNVKEELINTERLLNTITFPFDSIQDIYSLWQNISIYYYNEGVKLHNQWLSIRNSNEKELPVGLGSKAKQLQYLSAQSCENLTRGYALYQQLPDTTRARTREVGLSFELAMRRVCPDTSRIQENMIGPASTNNNDPARLQNIPDQPLAPFAIDILVVDTFSSEPIPQAEVRALGGNIIGQSTRAPGRFNLELPNELRNSQVQIEVSAKGYEQRTRSLPLNGSSATIALEPLPAASSELPPQQKPPSGAEGQTLPLGELEGQMILVRGGTFTMGCLEGRDDKDTDCDDDEKPAHQVRLSDFYIGKYEVTQAQWRAVMGSDPPELRFKGCDQCPVERVSWDDIQEFLKKLNEKTGKNYRLPTEAEWEYAARGGSLLSGEGRGGAGYQYAGSNNIDEVAWYSGNSNSQTHPVGQKKANELGIHDMSGNVYEWVQDCWNDSYQGAPANGKAWLKGNCARRVGRGGSWLDYVDLCRVSHRNYFNAVYRINGFGFRLAGY